MHYSAFYFICFHMHHFMPLVLIPWLFRNGIAQIYPSLYFPIIISQPFSLAILNHFVLFTAFPSLREEICKNRPQETRHT